VFESLGREATKDWQTIDNRAWLAGVGKARNATP
jgi:hypothetical protein